MSRKVPPFQPEAAEQLVSFIRAGGFPHVAAEAAGIARDVFDLWLEAGARKREPFCSFATQVRQAAAVARLLQEHAVYQKDPKFWLSHGPGKAQPAQSGWTGEVKPLSLEATLAHAGLSSSASDAVLEEIRRVLSEFPDANQAVARMLRELEAAEQDDAAADDPWSPPL
jgi:hypothetical protein